MYAEGFSSEECFWELVVEFMLKIRTTFSSNVEKYVFWEASLNFVKY